MIDSSRLGQRRSVDLDNVSCFIFFSYLGSMDFLSEINMDDDDDNKLNILELWLTSTKLLEMVYDFRVPF